MKRFFARLLFKYQLSRGKLIKVDERHRRVGKTTMMVKMSVKKNIPILVGSQNHIYLIKQYNENAEVYGFAKNFTKNVVGRRFPNGVLIDESVDPDMVKLLQKQYPNAIKIRGGFLHNYGSETK